jgi:branched-chain amino acid transport system permease protein
MGYLILAMMYVAMTQAWALLAGSLGEISFGQAAFFGIGAYTVALNVSPGGYFPHIPLPLDILLGGINAAIIAGIAGYPLLRLRGIYFAVGVLALSQILRIYFLAFNSIWIVSPFFGYYGRGGEGLTIPVILVNGAYSQVPYFYGSLGVMLITLGAIWVVRHSRWGLAFASIRDDPDAASMMGINTTAYRILCFAISAFFMGLVGGIFAYYTSFVYPNNVFDVNVSFEILVMGIFGGVDSFIGPIVGSTIVFAVNETARMYIPQGYTVILGAILIGTVLFLPGGIVGAVRGWMTRRGRNSKVTKVLSKGGTKT